MGDHTPGIGAWEVLMKSRLYPPGLHQSFPSYQWRVFNAMESA
jgi:hypothetical protein